LKDEFYINFIFINLYPNLKMLNTVIILTDFEDFYTLQIIGKILSVSQKNLQIRTLRVRNYSVIEASFLISQISKFFEKTIFVCVIDPYVGTKRRAVIIEQGKNLFVGREISARFVETFADEKEKMSVYCGSSGFIEIGKFRKNAGEILNATVGDKVEIC